MADNAGVLPDAIAAMSTGSPLISCIESAFGDTKYSDLSIKCGDRTWSVHRVIVCGQASFFSGAISGDFKESETRVVDLEEDDPDVVHEMLRYLYTEDYLNEPETTDGASHNGLVMSVLVHSIADKYNIPPLCQLANKKFADRASREWNIGAFTIAIEEMYRTAEASKEQMHRDAVRIATEHAVDLLYRDWGAKFRKAAESVPKFAAELAGQILKSKTNEAESRYKCPNPGCRKSLCMETVTSTSRDRLCPYCYNNYDANSWICSVV